MPKNDIKSKTFPQTGADDFPRRSALSPRSSALEWQAPEFEYRPKTAGWYIISIVVGLVLLGLALWQSNYLFAFFVVVGWFLIINLADRFPSIWEFKIDGKGINIRGTGKPDKSEKFYSWADVQGFDIHGDSDDLRELVIQSRSKLSSFIKINFPKDKEKEILDFCLKFIPREEYEDSAVDHLGRLIGF